MRVEMEKDCMNTPIAISDALGMVHSHLSSV